MNRRLVFTLCFSVLFATLATGQSLSTNSISTDGLPSNDRGTVCGSQTITHSVTQNVVAFNSVSCNAGGLHANNSYFRSFDLASFGLPDGFDVCQVDVAVESAIGAAGTQPVTVNLYTEDTPPFPGASRTLIGTTDFALPDQALSLQTIPVIGSAPAGSELVVEIFTPEGQTDGHTFFIGSNPDGQTAPSFLEAADCGITPAQDLAGIGFPNMHIVLNVSGNPGTAAVVPTLGNVSLILLIATLGLLGLMAVARQRRADL